MDIVVCGVGEQGVVLLAEAAAKTAMGAGLDVKQSEVHGMAQRGGSVVVYLRIGRRVLSPLIRRGGTDFLVALEPLEGLRYLHFLRRGGTVLVSDCKIPPLSVSLGEDSYPDDWRGRMEEVRERLGSEIESVLGIRAKVTLVEPGSIERSVGKAKRVTDKRRL